MYKRGLQVCAYHFLNFHLVSTSYLPTLVVVGVQQNYTPNGCLISCSEAPVAASDSRPVALSWSCLPHRGHSFLKNLLIYPVNASKKAHNCLYFPYWNSNSQTIRLVLERLKSVNMFQFQSGLPKRIIHKPLSVLWAFFPRMLYILRVHWSSLKTVYSLPKICL